MAKNETNDWDRLATDIESTVNEDTSIALGDLMIDYLRHFKDHLQQIGKRIDGC